MTEYTRLTVVGATRKAEMVVPNDEAVGSLVPRLMELLDESPGAVSRPLTLVRSTGEQLDSAMTVAEQSVYDGELVRLVREDAAPPPPEVADVTDVLADSLAARAGLWTVASRRATAAVAAGVLAAAAATSAIQLQGVSPVAATAGLYGLGLVVAVIAGRARGTWLAIATTAVSVGASLPFAVVLLALFRPSGQGAGNSPAALEVVVLGGGLVWLALALGFGAGLGSRAAWWGSVLGVLLTGLPLGMLSLSVMPNGALGVTAVVAVVLCGLLPWYAMSASGLTGLDDQVVDGRRGRREVVLLTVTDAYRTLTWATFAVAGPIAITAAALIASDNFWGIGLGVAVMVVTASRTRSMPIAAQSYALWAAVGVGALGGLLTQPLAPPWIVLSVLVMGLVVAIVGGGINPVEHQRASLRRVGNFAEAIAVAALLPLLLGVFGIYAELLSAF